MISPNCAVIMDATSTTSSYNAIERNAQSEHMCDILSDSMDGLIENELLEEPSQDPDDEDTFSDDSLRLRLSSDDEADPSQTGPTGEPAAPCISSEQTTSREKDMGSTESDEKVPFNNEIKSSIYKSCEPGSNKECQGSRQSGQSLNETHVGGKKNVNNMWREGNRKEHTSNSTIQSTKRSVRGHALHVRYNHSHSNIHRIPSYFNNHDNFGRPPGYRKYGSNWKYSKGKYLHSSTRYVGKHTVKEGAASNPKSNSRTEAEVKTDLLMSNESSTYVHESSSPASFNTVDKAGDITMDKTTKYQSENENCERNVLIQDDSKNDTSASVNDELSRECSHLNLDEQSTSRSNNVKDFRPNHSKWKDDKNVLNHTYNSEFASDDWFNEPPVSIDNHMQCTESSSSLLTQDSSNFKALVSSSPVDSPEPVVPPSKDQNEAPVSDALSSQNNSIESLNSAKRVTETGAGENLKDTKLDSNTVADIQCDVSRKTETDGPVNDAIEATNKIDDCLDSPKGHGSHVGSGELCTLVDNREEMELLNEEHNNIDKTSEKMEVENKADNNGKNEEPSTKDQIENGHSLLLDAQKVSEEPMKIVTEGKNTEKADTHKSCEIQNNVLDDISKNIDSDEKMIQVAECAPERAETVEGNEQCKSVCSETTNDQSNGNSKRNLAEKSSSEPASDIYSEMPPLVFLKRSLPDADSMVDKLNHKKLKIISDLKFDVCPQPVEGKIIMSSSGPEKGQEAPKSLQFVRKFFQRDMKGKLSKLKREELEELIIQKLVETITMRSEIGRLREQARISERNQEATRIRCQQLSKQIKDFDMVLSRNAVDRRSNNDKPVPPIKINRSVGLQVNFTTEHGIQSLRALSANNPVKTNPVPSPVTVNGGLIKSVPEKISKPNATVTRRGIKVRSPRRIEIHKNPSLPVQPQASTATPAALVMSKPADTSHNLSMLNNSKEQILSTVNLAQTAAAAKLQNIVVNGKLASQVNRQTLVTNNQKSESNDLIDLTEEEDKTRSISSSTANMLPRVGTVTPSMATKVPLSRFPRVVQAPLSANVAITTQSANIRVVQPAGQPTPTALVNNINATRLAYVVQGNSGAGRQLILPPNLNQIRPAVSTARGQFSNMAYKSGISTLANGTVRLVTTTAPAIPNLQPPPAPLPDTPVYPVRNGWKLPPPPPSLKISKVAQGIVLSWNMAQSDTFADIASYQLYAYQEIPGTPPNTSLWKKVGDVRALPLPMACTLKEFTPGNNYHFAVRAVDTHSRLGQYSIPRNISL